MSLNVTAPVRNLARRQAAGDLLTPGDFLNVIIPTLEVDGFECTSFGEGDLTVVSGSTVVTITFEIAGADDDDESDRDLSSWENDDGHWELGPYTQTADGDLTPDEDEMKKQMGHFSRNSLDVATARAIGAAVDGYDDLRRASL